MIGTREDYAALAALAEQSGYEFDRLAEWLEEDGMSVDDIRGMVDTSERENDSEKWVPGTVAERMIPGIYSSMLRVKCQFVRRKRGSGLLGMGANWLWHIDDIRQLRRLVRVCRLKNTDALRAFGAIKRGVA